FYLMTGLPCPSCGMTTSFAFLVRGDLVNSVRANAAGTILAAFVLALIPWNLACAIRGKLIGIRSLERTLTWLVAVFLAWLLARWLVVLGLTWGFGEGFSLFQGNEGGTHDGTVAAMAFSRPPDPGGDVDGGVQPGEHGLLPHHRDAGIQGRAG